MPDKKLIIIGGGLAGSEAAWQAAQRGISVLLYEMRPVRMTPAHKTGNLAELVCSNSMGSLKEVSAPGLLKTEMRKLGSLVLAKAEGARVPAGMALAVDRDRFSEGITQAIQGHPNITVLHEEVKEIPADGVAVIASGPLTSDSLAESLQKITRTDRLFFYDAISPIIDAESINSDRVFRASRYDPGEGDYLNCPMDEATYQAFYEAMLSAERVEGKSFEKTPYFEGCLPIEVMAERGRLTPVFGPMKPVGLIDPKTGKQPFAVVQLRAENQFGSCYNMVGFQTRMKWPEQRRIFRMIPGLEDAEFLRLGSLHRNTFINTPRLLSESLQLRSQPGLFMAGQIVGVEGYVESAAMGCLAGINATRMLLGGSVSVPPKTTAHGALIQYITQSHPSFFQPMNTNFGLFPPIEKSEIPSHLPGEEGLPRKRRSRKLNKALRHQAIVDRALGDLSEWIGQSKILADISA
ncbi:MAG: methylenetetrahydrofolate--tRNA-(uracil(54)-C(5))-methyltransferase (FADH(2)-oxidizing) TrmFO [Nitrospira sp.]|nr:methylenetetrahydrofolate--tRNA-(uracil(54)-C(5))-methyltransferase (FADH(2)-oxidizing) TrmFO [Candidatus Manganitrophaceae bacterium]HIL35269.1 methylenetetrahydrofolate--tRNA-(uracil(54)-C(5))-methyltransferase (FADH(2)-oxidizing) TrmFO [Candidatus Manganitrophaceae bacterium]